MDRRIYDNSGWSEMWVFAEPGRNMEGVVWTVLAHYGVPVQHEMTAPEVCEVRDALTEWLAARERAR